MNPAYLLIPAVLFVLGAVWWFRSRSLPPTSLMIEIRELLREMQVVAAENVLPASDGTSVPGIDQATMLKLTAQLRKTIRFVYTIEESDEGLTHRVSSQLLLPKPEKYQIQCMLIVMLTLNQCLEEAVIDPRSVSFQIDKSEQGTHYLAMALSKAQHDQLLAA
ncbi:MAG: hypothetical protein CBB71_15630 [Rhodopirellula sp. TMED11]|nr:MAG: hypothetical protein CBB71_15630 [Rhodopirellula sp. TMED11]